MPNTIKKSLFVYCPKSGRVIGVSWPEKILKWFFSIIAFFALVWFLIRVIPKPSRAAYPCQRAAFPLASAMILACTGFCSGIVKYLKSLLTGSAVPRCRLLCAGLLISFLAVALLMAGYWTVKNVGYVPPDGPNSPMGVAQGIFPGRVVWTYDPNATDWLPQWDQRRDVFYWDHNHTSQEVVERMISSGLQSLTGVQSDKEAWVRLFEHFNKTRNKVAVGYRPGQTVVIKPNHNNQDKKHQKFDNKNLIHPRPYMSQF